MILTFTASCKNEQTLRVSPDEVSTALDVAQADGYTHASLRRDGRRVQTWAIVDGVWYYTHQRDVYPLPGIAHVSKAPDAPLRLIFTDVGMDDRHVVIHTRTDVTKALAEAVTSEYTRASLMERNHCLQTWTREPRYEDFRREWFYCRIANGYPLPNIKHISAA